VPVNDRTVSKSAGLLDNLEGKQIWHITAPVGVSLKDLKELAMDKAMGGEAVLSYKVPTMVSLRQRRAKTVHGRFLCLVKTA